MSAPAPRNHGARLIEEVKRIYDDLTGDLGAVVRTALYYDPDVTAEQIIEIIRADNARARREVDPAIVCSCPSYLGGGAGRYARARGTRRHRMGCNARVLVDGGGDQVAAAEATRLPDRCLDQVAGGRCAGLVGHEGAHYANARDRRP